MTKGERVGGLGPLVGVGNSFPCSILRIEVGQAALSRTVERIVHCAFSFSSTPLRGTLVAVVAYMAHAGDRQEAGVQLLAG